MRQPAFLIFRPGRKHLPPMSHLPPARRRADFSPFEAQPLSVTPRGSPGRVGRNRRHVGPIMRRRGRSRSHDDGEMPPLLAAGRGDAESQEICRASFSYPAKRRRSRIYTFSATKRASTRPRSRHRRAPLTRFEGYSRCRLRLLNHAPPVSCG